MGVPLRGRDGEVAAVGECLAELARGRGGVLLIDGAPGAGKTRLLAEAATMARNAAFHVYEGAGDLAAAMMPLSPLLDALLGGEDPLIDPASLRALLTLPDPRYWLIQELQEGLEQAALRAPLVITIDDIQWADAQTLFALRTLPGRLSTHAIMWLLASRSGGATVTTDRLKEMGARTLKLRPLDPTAVVELARDVLGGAPDAGVRALTRDVEGRPFLLLELLRGLRDGEHVVIEDGLARLTDDQLPRRFRDTIVGRLVQLSDPARDLAQMASVLGHRFSVDHLAMVLDRPAPSLRGTLQEALDSGLLVERDDALAFRHDLIREAVETALHATMRDALRRRAVSLMLEHKAPAAEVAVLLLKVAEHGDRIAVGVLRQAAAELARTAPSTAATLSRQALTLTPADDEDRPQILTETIALLFGAGLLSEARGLADAALKGLLAPEAEARVRLELAQVCVQHSFAEVVRQCRLALSLPGVPPGLRLLLRIVLTLGFLLDGDFEDAFDAMDGDLSEARAAGDTTAEIAALTSCSAVSLHRHRYQEALDYAEEAEMLVSRAGPGTARLWPDVWSTWLRCALGEPGLLPTIEDGLRAAQLDGRAPDARWWLMCRARALLAAGRLADARAEGEAVFEMVDELGLGGPAMNASGFTLAIVALHTGDHLGLREAHAAARAMQADESITMRRSGAWIGALLADADGDSVRAMAMLGDTLDALGTLTPIFSTPQDACDILVLLRIVLRAGDSRAAETVGREVERRAALNPGFALHADLAAHARALIDQDADGVRASLGALARFPSPIMRAEVLEDAAGVLLARHSDEAVEHLDAALRLYDAAGAWHDGARVRRRLRDLGMRRRRPARARPADGWAGLTDSEMTVIRLVAGGATNRQAADQLFLSPHTVSSHLRHAFDKLNIRSRVELALLYADHERNHRASRPKPSHS